MHSDNTRIPRIHLNDRYKGFISTINACAENTHTLLENRYITFTIPLYITNAHYNRAPSKSSAQPSILTHQLTSGLARGEKNP